MTKYVDMLFQDTDFRDFYRLKDELLCEYKVLDPFQIKHSAPDDHFDYSEEIQLLAKSEFYTEKAVRCLNRWM